MKNQLLGYLMVMGLTIGIAGCGGGGGASSNNERTVQPAMVLSSISSSVSPASSSLSSSPSFVVSAAWDGGGTLTPSIQTVVENTNATLTVAADPGYQLNEISGCAGNLSGDIYTTGKITSACTVSAAFDLQRFTVTAGAGTGGTITPEQAALAFGEALSLTVAADSGFRIVEVSGCGGSLDGNTFIINGISADCAVDASFSPVTYTISGSTSGLKGGLQLAYQFDTGSETLDVVHDGQFNFVQQAQLGSSYQITVVTQPVGQECTIANGTGKVTGDVTDITVECESLFSISGTISPAPLITTDSDVNDIQAPFVDNSVPSQAQLINHLAHIQGFASAQGTGGDASLERFALTADPDDIFKVTLEAGQGIQLQVMDYKSLEDGGNAADLDLYLYNVNYDLVGVSERSGEFEELITPASGDHFIHVHAHAASSKYVLRLVPPSMGSTTASSLPEFVPNEMIVKYVDDTNQIPSTVDRSVGKANISPRPTLESAAVASLAQNRAMAEMMHGNKTAYEKVMTLRSIKFKAEQPDVLYAEPNYIRKGFVTPNDPSYALQWHYTAINLPDAWSVTTGSGDGQAVIVAVVDTGIVLAHPDMSGQTINGYDFISNADRARDGDGIDNNPDDPGDSDEKGQSSWHGTHVGGTVAATTNNGTGVAGVSWGAKIMPIRVLGKDGGTSYDIIQGLRYAAGLPNDSNTLPVRRADIANLSFGGPSSSRAEREAYQAVRAAGVILVAAAGNSGSSELHFPAAYPEVISVSATDFAKKLALYSSFGSTIALSAPGGNNAADLNKDGQPDGVLSAAADDSRGTIRYVYRFYNGTSMAAPHVSGVLALMKEVYPALTPDMVDTLIQEGSLSDDLGSPGRDDNYGYGFINAFKAVNVAVELAAESLLPKEPLPKITATPSPADFGFLSNKEISLVNEGGGEPTVVSINVNVEWLTISPSVVDISGLGSYLLTVDRADLVSGHYEGAVVFGLNDSSEVVVPVSMAVDTVSSIGELTQLYVLLVDSESLAVTAEVNGQLRDDDDSVAYTFPSVKTGIYYVVAGSDIDADGQTCQPGEMCGAYLRLAQPQILEVNEDVNGIDFSVDILTSFPDSTITFEAIERTSHN